MSNISSITSADSIRKILNDAGIGISGQKETSGSDFASIFSEALALTQSTDMADKISGLELLTGDVNDLAGVMIDSEKAEIALNLTIQLRNKVLDAYNEIMNMQV